MSSFLNYTIEVHILVFKEAKICPSFFPDHFQSFLKREKNQNKNKKATLQHHLPLPDHRDK